MIALNQYKNGLTDVLQEKNVIDKMYFFGSALTPRFNEKTSDIDILVKTKNLLPEEKGEQLIDLWGKLELLFNRKVDLLTEDSLKNPYLRKEIQQTRKLIYDGQSREVFI
ncbi:MAG: nucleotidyltransferase domain-containing protein [Prevotellaceae bacterium]|jgi:predicted nucleotidyltransferase|nr:nucleotidyltransferase domain-containing protein [Prevotellaceae bacterium]